MKLPKFAGEIGRLAGFIERAFPLETAEIADDAVTWEKIDGVYVADLAGVTEHIFTGLDGDADYGYELFVLGDWNAEVTMRFNGDAGATQYQRAGRRLAHDNAQVDLGSAGNSAILLAPAFETGGVIHTTIKARTGSKRTSTGTFTQHRAGAVSMLSGWVGGGWANTADNLVSIAVRFSANTFTGRMLLRKLG